MVDVALTEALFSMLEGILPEFGYFGVIRKRTGNIAHNSAPTNVYACADGDSVCIAANTARLFQSLFTIIGREDDASDPVLATNEGRVERAAELDAAIAAWTAEGQPRRWLRRCEPTQCPVSRINTIADIVADPQFLARDMLVRWKTTDSIVRCSSSAWSPSCPDTRACPAPAEELGASSEAIRRRTDHGGEATAEPAASEATR